MCVCMRGKGGCRWAWLCLGVRGMQVNATVFMAFGAENNKDGGKVFVEMSRTKTNMCVVRACMARMDVGGLGCVIYGNI